MRVNNRLQGEINKLSGESASLNFETYETYMALHASAVRLGATLSSVKLNGVRVDPDMEIEIDKLLDRYIMLD